MARNATATQASAAAPAPIAAAVADATTQQKPLMATPAIVLGKFGGRYAHVQTELYGECQRLAGLTKEQAHTIALALGSDAGRLSKHGVVKKLTNRVNKDADCTMKELAEITKVIGEDGKEHSFKESPALTVNRILTDARKLEKTGVRGLRFSFPAAVCEKFGLPAPAE